MGAAPSDQSGLGARELDVSGGARLLGDLVLPKVERGARAERDSFGIVAQNARRHVLQSDRELARRRVATRPIADRFPEKNLQILRRYCSRRRPRPQAAEGPGAGVLSPR